MRNEKIKKFILIFLLFCSLAHGNARRKLQKIKGYNSTEMLPKVNEALFTDDKQSEVSYIDTDLKERETSNLPHSTLKSRIKILDTKENSAADPDDESEDDDDDEEEQEAGELLVALNYMVSELQANEKGIFKQLVDANRNKSESCQLVLQELNISKATEKQITRNLTIELKKLWINNEYTSENMSLILSCLEYLVLDFKNAKLFNKLKGVSDIVLPMLNSSQPAFHEESAHVLAWALRSCPNVQITALRRGAIPILLKRVLNDTNSDVQIHSLYSLEFLTKNFPDAQALFVKSDGLLIFSELFERNWVNHRILIKVVSMILDLLLEHKHAIKAYHELDTRIKEIYVAVGLEKLLQTTGWCQKIFRVLLNQVKIGQENKNTSMLLESGNDPAKIIYDIDLPLVDICYSVFRIKTVEEKWFND